MFLLRKITEPSVILENPSLWLSIHPCRRYINQSRCPKTAILTKPNNIFSDLNNEISFRVKQACPSSATTAGQPTSAAISSNVSRQKPLWYHHPFWTSPSQSCNIFHVPRGKTRFCKMQISNPVKSVQYLHGSRTTTRSSRRFTPHTFRKSSPFRIRQARGEQMFDLLHTGHHRHRLFLICRYVPTLHLSNGFSFGRAPRHKMDLYGGFIDISIRNWSHLRWLLLARDTVELRTSIPHLSTESQNTTPEFWKINS